MLPLLANVSKASPCVVTIKKQSKNDLSIPIRLPIYVTDSFIHTLDLILPQDIWDLVSESLSKKVPSYAKLEMSLLDLLTGPFFERYITKGSVLMISSGKPMVENIFTLRKGHLTLELDKHTYEKCGLQGDPIKGFGRIHKQQRFRVKIDLGSPSMVRGKKMFDRLVYAFTNVLVDPIRWLFVDLLQNHQVYNDLGSILFTKMIIEPNVAILSETMVPIALSDTTYLDTSLKDVELEAQLLEYFGLLFIHSSSTLKADKTDPSLCMYQIPDSSITCQDLIHINYHGLLPISFVRRVLEISRQTVNPKNTPKTWWASRIGTFGEKVHVMAYTMGGSCLEWSA